MKKNKNMDWANVFHNTWKIFAAVLIFFILGILVASMLLYHEIVPLIYVNILLYAVIAWTSFATTMFAIFTVHHYTFQKVLIAQAIVLALLLFIGMLSMEMSVNWLSFGMSLIVAIIVSVITLTAFGGIKKKKFKKNASIRLKK